MASGRFAPLFWSFASGVVTALIITAGIFIWISNAPVPLVNKVQQVSQTVDPSLLDGKSIDPNRPLYSGNAVTVTDSQVASVTAGTPQAAPQGERFWVQAGTFSQSEDAESMRARIAFMGLDAQITNRSENGQRLWRVRIGPFESAVQAEEIKQSLADNGIQSTVLKLSN